MDRLLDALEVKLVESFRLLARDTAAELTALTERLAAIAPNGKIDWSDSWSDQDLREFTAASVRRLE